MRRNILLLLFLATYVISVPVFGSDMKDEIDHLLEYVENTECQHERNGKLHAGMNSVEHIKNKYNYFKKEIASAEQFIELSATKSTITWKYYMVLCEGSPKTRSREWLLKELKNYRRINSNNTFNMDLGDAVRPSAI